MTKGYRERPAKMKDEDWVGLARDAYRTSTDYFDSSLRRQAERNLDLFRSKHPAGSKYNSDAYKRRSHVFRPKTRATIRRNEAAAVVAYFSTHDGVSIKAPDESNPGQRLTASINNQLVNYRLDNTLKWFLTCIGAYQDSMVSGLVCSKQHWKFQTVSRETTMPLVDDRGMVVLDQDGKPQYKQVKVRRAVKDEPAITLVPFENLRIDPAADWTDPVNSSPYLIHLQPMYVQDVKEMAENGDSEIQWKTITDEDIQRSHARDMYYDSVRRKREGEERTDSKEQDTAVRAFDIVWVHENFIRWKGQDWVYYTLGTEVLISEPIERERVYLHAVDERPFVIGYSQIETHRPFPAGVPELVDGLQTEANDIANQRLDNVKLVLNRRYYMRRGARVDVGSLTRNVPGSITQMEDINNDVRSEAPIDVTSSSYQEQDRINADYDELAGNFSTGSIGTARNLNETVGGMKMLREGSNEMTEYQLRVFSETWMEPVVRQLVRMEQAYETDRNILKIAGDKAKIQDYGLSRVEDAMLQGNLQARVSAGWGATNPEKRIEKLRIGLGSIAELFPTLVQEADPREVVQEIFGALGYKDGERFFPSLRDNQKDPRVAELEAALAEAQKIIETKQLELDNKIQLETMRQEGLAADREAEIAMKEMDTQVRAAETLTEQEARKSANEDTQKTKIAQKAMELRHDARKFAKEMELKRRQGQEANYGLE